MRAYIGRRLLLIIPTTFLVTVIVFLMVRFIPGSALDIMEKQSLYRLDMAAIEKALGLDVPVFQQYGRWLGVVPRSAGGFSGLIQGDLGDSLWQRAPVSGQIASRWPVTLELGFMALVVAQLIALPIGVYSALRQDTWRDYVGRSFAILAIAVPGFWLGTMAIVFPSIWWGYTPSLMYVSLTDDPMGHLKMFVIPALVLGLGLSGITMRMTRSMMLEVLRQDYIRTAWTKGLRERVVIIRHALKNALIPVITITGHQISTLIGGTVIVEQIFGLPGMGRLMLNATLNRDYPVVSGTLLVYGIAVMLTNLIVDLTYAYLDPRIRYE